MNDLPIQRAVQIVGMTQGCVYIYEQRLGGFYVLKETNTECGVCVVP